MWLKALTETRGECRGMLTQATNGQRAEASLGLLGKTGENH
jgi:hypothetical protein